MFRVDDVESAAAVLAARRGMAARVAHDVNNLLTPLIAYPELIRLQASGNEQLLSLLGAMEKAAQDMLHLTGRLGLYAKGHEHRGEARLAPTIEAEVASFNTGPQVRVDLSVDESVADLVVPMAAESLRDVAHQLIENGLEATGAKQDRVSVSLRKEHLSEPIACAAGTVVPGHYAVMVVTDRGGGLAEKDVDLPFEPLYTTHKTVKGRGAGIGLSMALAMIADVGGNIGLLNDPGKGVTVRVYFPISLDPAPEQPQPQTMTATPGQPPAAAKAAGAALAAAPARYHGRVLIIDDEESIIDVFTIMLSEELPGIVVDSAGDGAAGVKQFEATRPDVVILDLHMPIMDGLTAFKRMMEVSRETGRPMPKVIFCTGYAPPHEFDKLMADRGNDGSHEVLYKPVSTRDLVARVASGVKSV